MGCYSLICAVSGLPIKEGDNVVGFDLEPHTYQGDGRYYDVPKSWPVFGKYNDYGGIKGKKLSKHCALIHRDIWDNAEQYKNKQYVAFENNLPLAEILSQENRPNIFRTEEWSLTDRICFALTRMRGKATIIYHIMELFNGQYINSDILVQRNRFGEIVCQKIADGMTKEDLDVLYKLCCLYSAQGLTGKYIMDSMQPNIEQSPVYDQRIDILAFQMDLLLKLSKKK